MLGVLYGGTDYTKLRPKGHTIQPTLEQIARDCKKRIKKVKDKYIYLATDEKMAVDYFAKELSECEILINNRMYFDEFYTHGETQDISSCYHNRADDKLQTSKEYLSSIFRLSKCNELIEGN